MTTLVSLLAALLTLAGCGPASVRVETSEPIGTSVSAPTMEESEVSQLEQFTMPNGKAVYYYIPQAVKSAPDTKVPLVLFMCGTTCNPMDNLVDSGWVELAEQEGLIVIGPDYNNYATYSETEFLISVVDYMLEHHPVDPQRVYSTGFSNGGAASVALTRDYPQYFAAISAMGWMVDLDNKNGVFSAYDMPFQVVQGNGEFTVKTPSGAMAVMEDEQRSVRSLLLYNEMIDQSVEPDYDKTPYWGYLPDSTESRELNGQEWQFCNYYKDGYPAPFAQLVIVEDSEHRPRSEEAAVAWDFFKQYKRDESGQIVSIAAADSDLTIAIGEITLTASLEENSSAQALRELLANGPLTIEMSDYGSMEKVGPLGTSLPTNNEQITTQAGDIILYQGSNLVIYYAPNSWNFTRLGRINNVSAEELREILGTGGVTVTLSFEQ